MHGSSGGHIFHLPFLMEEFIEVHELMVRQGMDVCRLGAVVSDGAVVPNLKVGDVELTNDLMRSITGTVRTHAPELEFSSMVFVIPPGDAIPIGPHDILDAGNADERCVFYMPGSACMHLFPSCRWWNGR